MVLSTCPWRLRVVLIACLEISSLRLTAGRWQADVSETRSNSANSRRPHDEDGRAGAEELVVHPARLREWLQGLAVQLPAFVVPEWLLKDLGIHLAVQGGVCSGITVNNVEVTESRAEPGNLQFGVALQGVSAHCRLSTMVRMPVGLHGHVDVEFRVEQARFTSSFQLASSSTGLSLHEFANQSTLSLSSWRSAAQSRDSHAWDLPDLLKLQDCHIDPRLSEFRFEGSGVLARALEEIQPIARRAIEHAGSILCGDLNQFAQGSVTDVLSRLSAALRPFLVPAAPLRPNGICEGKGCPAVDLKTFLWSGPLGRVLRSLVRDVAWNGTEEVENFNRFVKKLLRLLGLTRAGTDWPLVSPEGPGLQAEGVLPWTNGTAMFRVHAGALILRSLDSFDSIFASISPQTITTSGAFMPAGAMDAVAELRLLSEANVSFPGGPVLRFKQTQGLAPIRMQMSGSVAISGRIQIYASFDKHAGAALQLDQLQHPGCLPIALKQLNESLVAKPAVPDRLGVLELRTKVKPVSATMVLPELGPDSLEAQLLEVGHRLVGAASSAFGDVAAQLLDGLFAGPGRDALDEAVLAFLQSPRTHCPASNFTDGHIPALDYPARAGVGIFSLVALCVLVASVFLRRRQPARQRHHADGATPSFIQHDADGKAERSPNFSSPQLLCGGLARERPCERLGQPLASGTSALVSARDCTSVAAAEIVGETLSAGAEDCSSRNKPCIALGLHPRLPRALRYAMVPIILGTVCIFLVAISTVGVILHGVAIDADGNRWVSPAIANLSIDNTLRQMWTAKSYPLFVAILCFSVVWPYAKLLFMLGVWFYPMTVNKRGSLLVFLDQVGKWSLTDNFVLMVMIVVFKVSWSGVDVGTPDSKNAWVGLVCEPALEFHCFIVGTIASMVLGHVMLAAHRHVEAAVPAESRNGEAEHVAVDRAVSLLSPSRSFVAGLIVMTSTLALLSVAFVLPVVSLEIGGMIGVFLDLTSQPRHVQYCLWDFVSQLAQRDSPYLAAVLFVFAVLFPLLLVVALSYLLFVPQTVAKRRAVLAMCRTVSAWSSLDVLVVALFAAVLGGDAYGLGNFLELVIYSGNVAPLCIALRDGAGYECVTLSLSFLPWSWLLFATIVVNFFVTRAIFRIARVGCLGSYSSDATAVSGPPPRMDDRGSG